MPAIQLVNQPRQVASNKINSWYNTTSYKHTLGFTITLSPWHEKEYAYNSKEHPKYCKAKYKYHPEIHKEILISKIHAWTKGLKRGDLAKDIIYTLEKHKSGYTHAHGLVNTNTLRYGLIRAPFKGRAIDLKPLHSNYNDWIAYMVKDFMTMNFPIKIIIPKSTRKLTLLDKLLCLTASNTAEGAAVGPVKLPMVK